MKIALVHEWTLSRLAAHELQNALCQRVITSNQLGDVHTVAGIDVGLAGAEARAAIVALSCPGLASLEVVTARRGVTFPYIPGLLSFREAPAILAAAEALSCEPDLLVVDGQGIAHPRRFGIAAHLGVVLDKPTIGCAKTRLIGEHEPVGPARGDFSYLFDRGDVIGAVLRTKEGVKPVYVSVGHRIDLPTAIHYVLQTCRGYRLPEVTRRAHLAASFATASP